MRASRLGYHGLPDTAGARDDQHSVAWFDGGVDDGTPGALTGCAAVAVDRERTRDRQIRDHVVVGLGAGRGGVLRTAVPGVGVAGWLLGR